MPAASVTVIGVNTPSMQKILTPSALSFLGELHVEFNSRRLELLQARQKRQTELDNGTFPTFLEETRWIRDSNYKGASIPDDLQDRRVEITGPVDRKMVINALNSGANVFMADFEDSSSPTFENMILGQLNMHDAVRRTIELNTNGKAYRLKPETELATLMVRPRGWHLDEAHILVNSQKMSGSLVDFGLYFFHNAKELLTRSTGPYFYLPKLESHLEARLWNDVFIAAQQRLQIPLGTIRATVLIETILAAFEMDEIIYELRDHSAGLNCGRWDYIFSFIKKFRFQKDFVLPNRADVGMSRPFMNAYVRLLIQTCHRRGVHAMGGMAAQIPIKNNPEKNKAALDKVAADKRREVEAGHDGTWVAHPALIPIARAEFDQSMKGKNQISFHPQYAREIQAQDLLEIGTGGQTTLQGLKMNIDVGLRYVEAWLRGVGCVPLHNMMEDAATAEISRSQVWQWIHHRSVLDDTKQVITSQLVDQVLNQIQKQIQQDLGSQYTSSKFPLAVKLYRHLMLDSELHDFLTLDAYPFLVKTKQSSRI